MFLTCGTRDRLSAPLKELPEPEVSTNPQNPHSVLILWSYLVLRKRMCKHKSLFQSICAYIISWSSISEM